MRILETGWVVWDCLMEAPAIVEGRLQTGLSMEDADDLTGTLNRLAEAKKQGLPLPPPEEDPGGGDICSIEAQPSTDDDTPIE